VTTTGHVLGGALTWAAEYFGADPPLWRADGWTCELIGDCVRCSQQGMTVDHVVTGIDLERLK